MPTVDTSEKMITIPDFELGMLLNACLNYLPEEAKDEQVSAAFDRLMRMWHDHHEQAFQAMITHDPESPLPEGVFARIELPGYRQHTGWITEETRFGQQMAVVRDWDGREVAIAVLGPGCQVVILPTPRKRPEPPKAITAWGGGETEDYPEEYLTGDEDDEC